MISEKIALMADSEATLTTYLHSEHEGQDFLRERPAVLIFPGGGYRMCSDMEAEPIALAYMAEGFQAFVLRYSVGEEAAFPQPLKEAEAALALIRKNAHRWGLSAEKIAVVGFSAGGHLAASLGTMGEIKPNALVLCYAITQETLPGVVPFRIPDTVSKINEQTPPTFLTAATQDQIVSMSNSLRFAQGLSDYHVPFEMHIFKDGGHGFSLAKSHVGYGNKQIDSPQLSEWLPLSVDFLFSTLGKFEVKMLDFSNPEIEDCDEYSIDVNLLTLWSNRETRRILLENFPFLADEKGRQPALSTSLRMMAKFSPEKFSEANLTVIDEKLKRISVT